MRRLPPWSLVWPVRLAWLMAAASCGGSHSADNARAKARIFAPLSANDAPAPEPIDENALRSSDPKTQDLVLEMTETEAAQRFGSFRLRGKLSLRFDGPGQQVAIEEDRLVEQSKTGDLHLRMHDADGGGMEILWFDHKAYGRSRYGPYVLRDRLSGLNEQREEVYGALRTLYLTADRGFQLRSLGQGQGCERFAVSQGMQRAPPAPPKFTGRLDPDTAKRFQFVYGRKLSEVSGELCVDPAGMVRQAHVVTRWTAAGDAGSGGVRAEWTQSVTDLGGDVRVAAPENPEPEPHRPRGPFAVLNRFGFVQKPDAGE